MCLFITSSYIFYTGLKYQPLSVCVMLEEAFLPLEILMLQLCEKSQRSNEAASHWPHTPDQSYIHRGHRVTPNLPGPY